MKKIAFLLLALLAVYLPASSVVYLDLDGNVVDQSYTSNSFYAEMYAPENPNGISVMIYPGGAYAWKGMTYEGSDFAPFFNELGITVFVVSYQLPYGTCTAPLESCEHFMRAIKNNANKWNINPDSIGVMGSSAGGHLASTHATAFNTDTRPVFQILLYPVISMSDELTHAESRTNLLGTTNNEQKIYQYSNELQVKDNTPMVYIAVSEDDWAVPVDNSILYYKACIDHNVPAELHIYPTGGHGWGYNSFDYHDEFLATLKSWIERNVINQ